MVEEKTRFYQPEYQHMRNIALEIYDDGTLKSPHKLLALDHSDRVQVFSQVLYYSATINAAESVRFIDALVPLMKLAKVKPSELHSYWDMNELDLTAWAYGDYIDIGNLVMDDTRIRRNRKTPSQITLERAQRYNRLLHALTIAYHNMPVKIPKHSYSPKPFRFRSKRKSSHARRRSRN